MKVVALVLSTFILALLCHEVRCQECGTNTTWSMSTYSVSEGAGIVSLTARQGSSGQALQFSSRADTAIAGPPGGDYNGASGILTFSASTEQMVIISVNNDDETEETESFFVDLSLLDGTVCSTATVFILDDEPTEPPPTTPPPNQMIEWQQSKYNISEGGSSLDICAQPAGSLSSPVTVTVTIEDGTATFSQDYFSTTSEEWTFTDSSAQCITIFIINDNQAEGLESIRASFIQGGFDEQETTVCILDDEAVINIQWEEDLYDIDEGVNAILTICAVTDDVIIGDRIEERLVIFRNDSAIAGQDFVDPGVQMLQFSAGDDRMCIEIVILDDSVLESLECFYVDLVSTIQGVETSTTKIQINDDEGQVTLNVEREIYTVVEGNYLEVCVVIADGGVAAFPFNVTGHVLFFGYPVVYFFIYFSIGDTRGCASTFFPGNDYLDKLEREKEIFFVIEESEFSEFVQFDRNSAWCFLADDDIVSIGFADPTYTALEDGGYVQVCLELCEGSINRPIDVLLYTDDGSALDGVNYEGGVRIVTLLAYGASGDRACTNISILDDGVPTPLLYFSLNIYISDTHVLIPDDKANATVFIQPAFEICFDMDSPRVNGSELFLSFESTVPVDMAVCSVDSLPDQDCSNGSALFIFTDAARTETYDVRIEASFGSETRILENSVRSELTDICDVHLINKGTIFNGNNATIYVQPTGPDPDARILNLECRCRESLDPAQDSSVFAPCPAGTMGMYDTVHFEFVFPDDCVRLSVRAINDGRCSPRRALQIDLPSAAP